MKATTTRISVIAIAGLVSTSAQAVQPELSGFVDMTYVMSDGTYDPDPSPVAQTWGLAAEMDYKLDMAKDAKARFDLDMNLVPDVQYYNPGVDPYPVVLEQAFMGWKVTDVLQISAGAFNNPLGWEAEDAPDLFQVSHGQIYSLFDQATVQYGNNVTGIAGSVKAGIALITIGLFNDLGGVPEEISFGAMVNLSPIQSLDIEAGMLTQDANGVNSMEQIIDANITWKDSLMTIGGEFMTARVFIDYAAGFTFNYQFSPQAGATFRYDTVAYEAVGVDSTNTITLAGSYMVEKNLAVNVELRMQDDPNDPNVAGNNGIIGDGDILTLEFIASF